MKQLIEKLNSSILNFQPTMEYLTQFQEYEVVSEDLEDDNGEINILSENEVIKIVYTTVIDGHWLSIYRYNQNGIKYEQIDVMMYDRIKEKGYNIIVKFSGHIEDNDYSYITCSNYFCLDNIITKSWKETRVVPLEDMEAIQYTKDMNLTELICMADSKGTNIIKKSNEKGMKTLELKLQMFQ